MYDSVNKYVSWVKVRRKTFKELFVYALQTYGTTFVSVIGAIVIVRILNKSEYGMYGIIFSVSGILNTIFNAGIVRLSSTEILSAPLEQEQRRLLHSYVRNGFIWSTSIALTTTLLLIPWYGWKAGIYAAVLYIAQQFFGFVGLIFYADMREHKLRNYYTAQSVLEYCRVLFPILGVLLTGQLYGYFVGSLISAFVAFAALWSFGYWRIKIVYYADAIAQANASWRLYKDYIKLGFGVALESGAATLYGSIIILAIAYKLGLQDTASLKVMLGYFSAIGMLLLPFTRWVTLHLPRRTRESKKPFMELIRFSIFGFFASLILYFSAVLAGHWLFPLVYGQTYAASIPYLPYAGLFFLFSGAAIGMSVVSRQYNLSWQFATISLVNVVLGTIYLFSPVAPITTNGFAMFYGLWIIPALIASYVLAYTKIPHKVDHA